MNYQMFNLANYETVDDNPYLNDFYNDMQRWSFNLQIYFLNSRFGQIVDIRRKGETVIQDRTIYEDAHILVKLPNGKYLDSNGEHTKEEILPNAMFSNKIEKIRIVPIDEETALNTFSCQDQEKDIEKVMDYLKSKQ